MYLIQNKHSGKQLQSRLLQQLVPKGAGCWCVIVVGQACRTSLSFCVCWGIGNFALGIGIVGLGWWVFGWTESLASSLPCSISRSSWRADESRNWLCGGWDFLCSRSHGLLTGPAASMAKDCRRKGSRSKSCKDKSHICCHLQTDCKHIWAHRGLGTLSAL